MSDRPWNGGYSDYSTNRAPYYPFSEPPPPGENVVHETRNRPSRWDNPYPSNFSNQYTNASPRPFYPNNYWQNCDQNYQNFNPSYNNTGSQYNPYNFHYRPQNRFPPNFQRPPPLLGNLIQPFRSGFQQRSTASGSQSPEKSVRNGQQNSSETQKSDDIALPGSKAARERERAEIAQRLKDLDSNKGNEKTSSETNNEKGSKVSSVQKVSSIQSKLIKKNKLSANVNSAAKTKSSGKAVKDSQQKNNKLPVNCTAVKRKLPTKNGPCVKKKTPPNPNKSSTNSISGSSEDLKNKILSRLSAMGKEELKKMINNPQCSKSQAIMKALMKCYQETKALELDKRRFTAVPDSSSASSPNLSSNSYNFAELPSITMTDLPPELVSQIESFLGCGVFPTPHLSTSPVVGLDHNFLDLSAQSSDLHTQANTNSQPLNANINQFNFQNGDQLTSNTHPNFPMQMPQDHFWLDPNSGNRKQVDVDTLSDTTTVRAPSPSNIANCQPVFHNQVEYPFLIIKELSEIDFHIQECLQRRMQLYNDLHAFLQSKQSNLNPIILPAPSQPQLQTESDSSGVSSTFDHTASALIDKTPAPPEKICEERIEISIPAIIPKPEIIEIEDDDVVMKEVETRAPKASKKTSKRRSSSTSSKKSKCQDCHISDSVSVKFSVPEKTNVNDMKLIGSSTIVLACDDGRIYGYNCKTGKLSHAFVSHTASVTVVCGVVNNDNTFLLCSGSMDEHLCLFESSTQDCVSKHYLASTITSLECHKGRLLYIGLSSGQILKYCLLTKQLMMSQIDFECSSSITALMSSKEGPRKILFVAAKLQPLSMRDANSGLLIRSFVTAVGSTTYSLAVFGDLLFSGDVKHNVPYFNRLTGNQEGELSIDGNVACIRLYRHILFVACYNGKIHAFDLKNKMKKLVTFTGAGVGLSALQVRNNQIISCSRNKKMESISFPPEVIASLKSSCACKNVSTK